jgi:serine/threonine-protein kinase
MAAAAAAGSERLGIEPIYYTSRLGAQAAMLGWRSLSRSFALSFDESSSLSAPTAFGSYRVLHQIGSGVLGPVFRTHDPRADRLLAVKVFRLDLPPDGVARLADALRRLAATPVAHPSLVPLVDAGVEGTSAFLVMEYESGDTLDIALRRFTPATLEQALPVLSRIAAGLDAAAEAGLTHGALHPRDVFLSAAIDEVKMTGFGVVQALEAAGVSSPVLRRPYVAPERANGRWDHRADVYSLGVIAHELLTGRRPVGLGEQDGVLASELQPQQRVLVRRVLSTALAERPEQRYPSGAALIAALEEITTRDLVGLPGAVTDDADQLTSTSAADATHEDRQHNRRATDSLIELPEVEAAGVAADTEIVASGEADTAEAAETTDDAPAAETGLAALAAAPSATDTAAPVAASDIAHPLTLPLVIPASRAVNTLTPPGGIPPAWSATRRRTVVPWIAVLVTAAVVVFGVLSGYRTRTGPAPAATEARVDGPSASPAPNAAGAPAGPASAATPDVAAPLPSSEASPAANAAPLGASASSGGAAAAPNATAGTSGTAASNAPVAAGPATAPSTPAQTDTAPAQASRAPEAAGELVVRSDPPGALVTIDGRILGETPLVARGLSLGAHAVQVARPGHVPRAERVVFRAPALSQTLDLRLVPGLDQSSEPAASPAPPATSAVAPAAAAAVATTSGPGAIDIDSRPRGAQVSIDGRLLGAAPLRAADLAAGEHLVTIELPGYATWTGRVMVVPGRPTPVHASLEIAPQ